MRKIMSRESSSAFRRSLSCSQALMTVLDGAMENENELFERAAHPLAGGVMRMGRECGMIWGAELAAGVEAFKRFGEGYRAEAAAIAAAQTILKSFQKHTGNTNCGDITDANLLTLSGRIKYIVTGKAMGCARMAVRWAPLALEAINAVFENFSPGVADEPASCASLVARKMGASGDEAVTVSGLAGGIGLSGGACGALAAAIWMTTLKWYRDHPEAKENFTRALVQEFSGSADFHPATRTVKSKFMRASNGKILCREIVGRNFEKIKDHADFLKKGGCADLINALAASQSPGS